MKLCILTNILAPYRIPLFEALAARVEELTVVVMAERHANRDWTLPAHRFRTVVLRGLHIEVPMYQEPVHLNLGVMRTLRSIAPDVVVSGGFVPANIAAWIYCRLHGRRYVSWGELTLLDGAQRSRIRRWIRRALISSSDAVVASSSVAKQAFEHYGARRDRLLLSVMPVDVDFFRKAADDFRRSPEYPRLRAQFTSPVLISVGRLTDIKGYDELFEIYAQVLGAHPQATLLIVGDGPEREKYQRNVAARGWRNVHFLGFQQPTQLAQWLAVADLFVFHTRHDPFGAVLSEAMAAGTLSVSSIHAAATHDLIADRLSGFIIDPAATTQSSLKVIEALQLDAATREKMCTSAWQSVSAWTFERAANDIVALAESLRAGPVDGSVRATTCAD